MSMNSADNRNSTKVSKSSSYLSPEENELVFHLVGRRCVSQCTTVAQLFLTEGPSHSRWIKKHTGALCFVKDNAKRSYFCRMYCLMRHELVWEQEMYDTVDLSRTRPYLLTFEGQDGIVAFNFAFEDETETFLLCAKTTVANRNRRREERRHRTIRKEPPARPPPITNNVNNIGNKTVDESHVTLRYPPSITKLAPPQGQSPYQQDASFTNSKIKKREGTRKLTKADIGGPSNFKHVTHVGWDARKGFDLSGEDEALKKVLQKAGVSESHMQDRKTRDFIYDFIQKNKDQSPQSDEKPARIAPPPPPPARDFTSEKEKQERVPPRQRPAPPLPTTTPKIRSTPTRPAPIQHPQTPSANVPPPPPPPNMPPPPPMMNMNTPEKPAGPRLPVIPDARSALMDSIRSGGAGLKKVEVSSNTSNSGSDPRNNLLSAIHKGVELRPVGERPTVNRSSGDGGGNDALADALRRALEQRRTAVQGDSSSEESEQNSDDGEWD